MIRNLEKTFIAHSTPLDICLPELYYELTLLQLHEGNMKKALEYCHNAKYWFYYFADATYNSSSLKDAKRVANLYYSLFDWDTNDMAFLDLLYLFQKPATVKFILNNKLYNVEAFEQNNRIIVKFQDEYFGGPIDFITKAMINDSHIYDYKKIIQFIEVIR